MVLLGSTNDGYPVLVLDRSGLAIITDRAWRLFRTENPWVGDSHSLSPKVKSSAARLGELEVSVCRLEFSFGSVNEPKLRKFYCMPYTYGQSQNSQNPRYQPPHNRQPYPSTNTPPISYDEALRTFQRENQEMREAQKRTESQLSHFTELLHKFTNQTTISQQVQPQPSTPSPLPSQPVPNPKGELADSDESDDEEEVESDTEEEVDEEVT
ncbi:hypothetical protein PIB30_058028 [Stylosanthes scabra]|uniref:Uncharacterized protein n=1 Tax=Stylosanthes scabra TaxID=79078 RepID=A0ABU6TM18_9FABA|nr:hypothetical protein [Stylosanthes scabra]